MSHGRDGFTLLELIITLAIIAIFLILVIPSFENEIMKARRADAKTALYDLAARLEQFYLNNQTYATATIARNPKTDVLETSNSPNGYYHLAILSQDESHYVIQATPNNNQAEDKDCGSFRLDSSDQKSITGRGDVDKCWY